MLTCKRIPAIYMLELLKTLRHKNLKRVQMIMLCKSVHGHAGRRFYTQICRGNENLSSLHTAGNTKHAAKASKKVHQLPVPMPLGKKNIRCIRDLSVVEVPTDICICMSPIPIICVHRTPKQLWRKPTKLRELSAFYHASSTRPHSFKEHVAHHHPHANHPAQELGMHLGFRV